MVNAKIVATRGRYRLVHQSRDEKAWPNVSDLVLERADTDALGEQTWTTITTWCLAPQLDSDLRGPHESAYSRSAVALKMLLDAGPVEK